MPNPAIRGILAAALIVTSGTAGAAYKCKDANGRITYSEQPCPSAATQTKIRTDADVREEFVRGLKQLASHEALWDPPLIEKTLGVRLVETQAQHGVSMYSFAATPAGNPVVGSRLVLPGDTVSWGGGNIELRLDPGRCVSPAMIRTAFGADTSLQPEMQMTYVVKAGSYKTEVAVSMGYKKGCAEYLQMRQVPPPQPAGGGRRSRQ